MHFKQQKFQSRMSKDKNEKSHSGFETVEEALSKTELYIEQNRKSLTIIIVAIAAVVGVYFAYRNFYLEPKENEAQASMFMAEFYFEQDSFLIAVEGDGSNLGFVDIIDEFGATKSANLANYYAGICYLRLGQYEKAIEYLEQFDGKDRLVATIALGATGDSYVELGNLKKGVSYYQKAANLYDNEVLTPLYLKKSGIAYEELGDLKKALIAYKEIKKSYPASDEAQEIDKYIASIEVRL